MLSIAYVGDDRDLAQALHDLQPDPDVLDPLRDRPPVVDEELLPVQPQLEDVVQEGEERGQRERRHEDGDEAVLDHCQEVKNK